MAIYSFYALPSEAFCTTGGGYQPFNDSYIAPDGSGWQYATGTFTYSRDMATKITINDTDDQGSTLNDYDGNQTTQQLVNQVGPYHPGSVVENEFEITLTAIVDGKPQEYRLVAISANGQIAGYTFDGAWPPEGVQLTSVWKGTDDSDHQSLSSLGMQAPCFTRGVMIATPEGLVAIEDLAIGDLVLTRDHGPQPIRWIGSALLNAETLAVNPKLLPIRIGAGALGAGLPLHDLLVSPQHRVLVRSKIAINMFGTTEVLAAAKQLLLIDGIDVAVDLTQVEYFHMLFDQHEIVLSNGAETESLYPGPEALKSVGQAAIDEIYAIFPELARADHTAVSARPLLSGRQSRKLAVRHIQHARPLVTLL